MWFWLLLAYQIMSKFCQKNEMAFWMCFLASHKVKITRNTIFALHAIGIKIFL